MGFNFGLGKTPSRIFGKKKWAKKKKKKKKGFQKIYFLLQRKQHAKRKKGCFKLQTTEYKFFFGRK